MKDEIKKIFGDFTYYSNDCHLTACKSNGKGRLIRINQLEESSSPKSEEKTKSTSKEEKTSKETQSAGKEKWRRIILDSQKKGSFGRRRPVSSKR